MNDCLKMNSEKALNVIHGLFRRYLWTFHMQADVLQKYLPARRADCPGSSSNDSMDFQCFLNDTQLNNFCTQSNLKRQETLHQNILNFV